MLPGYFLKISKTILLTAQQKTKYTTKEVFIKNNSDFRMTPCAGENVRVVGAILLPAIVRRRPDFMSSLPAHFFCSGSRWQGIIISEKCISIMKGGDMK